MTMLRFIKVWIRERPKPNLINMCCPLVFRERGNVCAFDFSTEFNIQYMYLRMTHCNVKHKEAFTVTLSVTICKEFVCMLRMNVVPTFDAVK